MYFNGGPPSQVGRKKGKTLKKTKLPRLENYRIIKALKATNEAKKLFEFIIYRKYCLSLCMGTCDEFVGLGEIVSY